MKIMLSRPRNLNLVCIKDPQSLKALYISTIYMGVCSGFFLLLKKNTFFDTIFAIQSFRNMFKKAITLLAKKWHF
jgi:hypothetical protein